MTHKDSLRWFQLENPKSLVMVIFPAFPRYGRSVSELERIQQTKLFFRVTDRAFGDAIAEQLGEVSPVKGRRGHKRGLVSPPASWSSRPQQFKDRPQITLARW